MTEFELLVEDHPELAPSLSGSHLISFRFIEQYEFDWDYHVVTIRSDASAEFIIRNWAKFGIQDTMIFYSNTAISPADMYRLTETDPPILDNVDLNHLTRSKQLDTDFIIANMHKFQTADWRWVFLNCIEPKRVLELYVASGCRMSESMMVAMLGNKNVTDDIVQEYIKTHPDGIHPTLWKPMILDINAASLSRKLIMSNPGLEIGLSMNPNISLRDYIELRGMDDVCNFIQNPGVRQLDLCTTGFRYNTCRLPWNPNCSREYILLHPIENCIIAFTWFF